MKKTVSFEKNFKLLNEIIFALCYIAAICAKDADNIVPLAVLVVFMLSILCAINIYKYKSSIPVYLLLAIIGICLIFSRGFMNLDKLPAISIIIVGTLMCFPFIAKTV